MENLAQFEADLWEAAHNLRANSGLKSAKSEETGCLCRLNLAVHGLEHEIKHGGQVNSYYDDPHDATGRCPFYLLHPNN